MMYCISHVTESVLPTSFEYFIVVTPGFETQASAELKSWFPHLDAKVEKGGLTVQAPFSEGLAFNDVLKIPTRVLVRAADFGCKDFPKFFKKLSSFKWSEWIADSAAVEFQASSHSSRLYNKRRIEETAGEARAAYLKKNSLPLVAESTDSVKVMIRFIDDVCTMSFDTSGERLHKRGVRELSSDAPLRETIAAALLWALAYDSGEPGQDIELVDPMTGGGTFLIEAIGLPRAITTREFAGQKLKSNTAPQIPAAGFLRQTPFSGFVGVDESTKAIASARENLSGSTGVTLVNGDLFEVEPLPKGPKRWLIANPPYGERIKVDGSLTEFYGNLFAACERFARPERACFILPQKAHPDRIKMPKGWRAMKRIAFANGGIPVNAVFYSGRGD